MNNVGGLQLNSGNTIPQVGLGTFRAVAPGEVKAAVKTAVRAGYRLIDCAAAYGNQAEVGEAISELIREKTVTRKELFIVSKLFQTHHVWEGDKSRCHETLAQTLADLKLDYVDLFLMHWPFGFAQKVLEKPLGTKQPLRLPDGSPNPIWTITMEYLATWQVMEEMQAAGLTKSIGVSNFTVEQLRHLMDESKIPPAVNQVELHPYLQQHELVSFCAKNGIVLMAYSPLGSSSDSYPPEHRTTLLHNPIVNSIARETGKSVGQVLVKWGIQQYPDTLVSLPKSSNPARITQNIEMQGWELSAIQMESLAKLDCGFRYFLSYLKKPDNEILWHDGVIETHSCL
jgi:alcohol dehydrogenase (NADP+)